MIPFTSPSPITNMRLIATSIRGSLKAGAGLPEDALHALLVSVHIVDLIHARVPLTKQGREYGTLCPFHEEQSPSFTVSPLKQFYHCFGCGAHGTALAFLQRFHGISMEEAIVELMAVSAGVPKEVAIDAWVAAWDAPPPPSATVTHIRGDRH